MADIETYGKYSQRRADKGSKVQRILNLFEISRPNKGLQRTNSLPNGKRPSLSSNDLDVEGLSSRGSLRRNGRKTQKNKEETEANLSTKCKRSLHQHQILEEPDELKTEEWRDDEEFTLSKVLRLQKTLAEIMSDEGFRDSDNFCDSYRLSMETLFHGIGAGKRVRNGDSGSDITNWDFMRSRSHEERLQSPLDSDESQKNYPPTDEEPEVAKTPPHEETDTPELEEIEWWKHKSFVQINNENPENSETSTNPPGSPVQGRFRKNNQSGRSRRRTGILKKPFGVKELAQHFESFTDAAEKGETENYRRSVICEIDSELENMKLDGYGEDFHLMLENLEDGEAKTSTALLQLEQEDLFGEIYFAEDMEKGFYYMEAWNADGKELIKCSVQIERKSIDLLSFDQMKTNEDPNILSNDDKMVLVLGSQASDDSKRNTMYSTTSGESYDDEDNISWTSVYVPSAARRETFCDQQGVVRIERVDKHVNSPSYICKESTNEEEEEEEKSNYYESIRLEHQMLFSVPVEVKKNTLQYIIDEIISTERKYVADMEKVIVEYKSFLEERCPEKVDAVFGNMEQIYSNQTDFLHALESPQVDIKAVAQIFLEFEDLFRLYPRYFRNTPKANAAVKELSFLIKEKQERINDKLDLSAYLLTPIQRLGKYKLFLENIIKQLQKEDRPIALVELSLEMVKKYMSKGNDAVALASILYSPLHTKDYGSFIAREKFTVLKPKKAEMMVFLFEGVVVFTLEDPKNLEQFEYQKSIRTHDLRIATFDNDNTIQLTDFTKTKRRNSNKHTYVLDTKSPKVKETWKMQIEDILWKQMKKIKENTLKAYQNSDETPVPVRKNPRRREQRAKSTGASVFYVDFTTQH